MRKYDYLVGGTPMACSIAAYNALECFLFSATPKAPMLIKTACAAGSLLPPNDMLTPPITVATQYCKKVE